MPETSACTTRATPETDNHQISPSGPSTTLARQKNTGMRPPRARRRENFIGAWRSRAGHQWTRRPEQTAAEQDDVGEPIWAARVSRKPLARHRSSIQRKNRLGTNALHWRDKNEDRAPHRTPREEPPAREDEKKKKPNTNKHQIPEPGGLG